MKERKKQIKQVSFRLYDTPRDRKIFEYLESLQENQAEYLRRLVEQQMDHVISEKSSKIAHTEIVKEQVEDTAEIEKSPSKRLSGGFRGFRV
ncbi:hypothetical protein AB9M75_10770 [Lactobacillus sp. AN1001]